MIENIGKLLKHPLVVIIVASVTVVVFYYIASPYKNCVREYVNYQIMPDPTVTMEQLEVIGAKSCNEKHSW